jgi:hypothetical protein
MQTIVIQREAEIARPVDVVRRQFVDMEHHCDGQVHAALGVSNVRRSSDKCLFTGRRRVFGMLHEDEIEVTSLPDGSSTLRSVAGTNVGLLVTQRFEALGAQSTRVTVTVEFPVAGMMKLLAPLVKLGLQRDAEIALREDKADLEHRYMQAEAS